MNADGRTIAKADRGPRLLHEHIPPALNDVGDLETALHATAADGPIEGQYKISGQIAVLGLSFEVRGPAEATYKVSLTWRK